MGLIVTNKKSLNSINIGEVDGFKLHYDIQLNPLTSLDALHALNVQALPGIQ